MFQLLFASPFDAMFRVRAPSAPALRSAGVTISLQTPPPPCVLRSVHRPCSRCRIVRNKRVLSAQFPSMNMGMDMGFPKMHFPKMPKLTAQDFAGGSVLRLAPDL